MTTEKIDWQSAMKVGLAEGQKVEAGTEWAIVIVRVKADDATKSWNVEDVHEGKMKKAATGKCLARINSEKSALINPREAYGGCAICGLLCCHLPCCCFTGKFYVKGCVLIAHGEYVYAVGASGSKNCLMDVLVAQKTAEAAGFSLSGSRIPIFGECEYAMAGGNAIDRNATKNPM